MNMGNFESEILACAQFQKAGDDDKFLSLIKSVEGKVDEQIATVLVRPFSDADDCGVQERTRNALQLSDRAAYYPALIAELRHLVERSPEKEWGLTLIGMEFEYGAQEQLVQVASRAPEEQKDFFFRFISRQEFLDEYPSARQFIHG